MQPRNKITKGITKLFKWFHENSMKANEDICHFVPSLDISTKFSLPACILENSGPIAIPLLYHSKLTQSWILTSMFRTYVMRKNSSRKIQILARIFPYILQTQKRILMNTYFISQFGYCSLVWMMNHSRTLNNRINVLHKRTQRLLIKFFRTLRKE